MNTIKTDLSCDVDYDYERSGCTCNDDICRCTTIESAWIEMLPVSKVIQSLFKKHSRGISTIDRYCFDRICHVFKIYDKDLYEIETTAGYYGEEIGGVYFEDEEKIFQAFQELLALDSVLDKIKFCLKLEYGYLIDSVESACSAAIIEVPTKNIVPAQKEYFVRLSNQVYDEYKNSELPIAVCVRDGDKYRIIDGYHRFVANKDRDKVDIIILDEIY